MDTSATRSLRFWWCVICAGTAVLAGAVYLLGAADHIPIGLDRPAIWFMYPGFLVRGLLSPGELGWQDWRDVVLMGVGSGLIWGTVATSAFGAWRHVRTGASNSGAA